MSCSPFDLRDYFLQELPDPQQRAGGSPCERSASRAAKSWTGCALRGRRCSRCAMKRSRSASLSFPTRFSNLPLGAAGWPAFWGSAARLGFARRLCSRRRCSCSPLRVRLPHRCLWRTRSAAIGCATSVCKQAADKAAREIEARYAAKTEQLVKAIQQRDSRTAS